MKDIFKNYKFRIILIIFLCSIFTNTYSFAGSSTKGYKNIFEVTGPDLHEIKIPLHNITRIACFDGIISKPIFSSEKVLQVSKGNNNDYFLKISVITIDGENGLRQSYDDRPRDLFVSCSDEVFSLKLTPDDSLNATTIILKPSKSYNLKEKTFEENYDEKILDLIKSAYFELVPNGYKVKTFDSKLLSLEDFESIKLNSSKNSNYKVIGNFFLTKRLSYIGSEFIVEDWLIINNAPFNSDDFREVHLKEKYFYTYFKDYRAISLTVQKLNKYVPNGRLIAVRRNFDKKF